MNMLKYKSYALLLFLIFVLSLVIEKSYAQLGYTSEALQDSLADESTYKILALTLKNELLTYTVRSKEEPLTASILFYLGNDKKVEKIYISSFNASAATFLSFTTRVCNYTLLGTRLYKSRKVYELNYMPKNDLKAFVYYHNNLWVFSTNPEEQILVGEYSFEPTKQE